MGIETAYTYMGEIFGNLQFFDQDWMMGAIFTVMTVFILTRDKEKMKEIAFPVALSWHIAGLQMNLIILIALAIQYTLQHLSLQVLGDILTNAKTTTQEILKPGWTRTGVEKAKLTSMQKEVTDARYKKYVQAAKGKEITEKATRIPTNMGNFTQSEFERILKETSSGSPRARVTVRDEGETTEKTAKKLSEYDKTIDAVSQFGTYTEQKPKFIKRPYQEYKQKGPLKGNSERGRKLFQKFQEAKQRLGRELTEVEESAIYDNN